MPIKKGTIMNKKQLFCTRGTVLLFTLLSLSTIIISCKAKSYNTQGKIQIVATIFPEYDWLMNIAGPNNDKIIPKLLIKNGVDVHSYNPSVKDITDISSCDILMFVGGESDEWIKEVIKEPTNKNMIVLNCMDIVKQNLLKEELKEGMQDEQEHNHNEEHHNHIEENISNDEHIWFSIQNVRLCVTSLCNALCSLDSQNEAMYQERLATYLQKLDELDLEYKSVFESCKKNTIIVCDRFPFSYLVNDYNLDYYAAFLGCSSETNASFETVTFLSSKIDELDCNNVIVLESSNKKLAKTIINESSHKLADILVLDSMQTTTLNEIFNGKTYIATMKDNLEVLKKALN